MKKRRSQPLPLANSIVGKHIFWMMAVQVFIALCVSLISLLTAQIGAEWQGKLLGRFIVVVPSYVFEGNNQKRTQLSEEIEKALLPLESISEVYAPPSETLTEMLFPWLNSSEALAQEQENQQEILNLPRLELPLLVDVQGDDELSARVISQALKAKIKDFRVDDHGAWRAQFLKGADVIKWSGIFVFLMLLAAVGGLVLVMARAIFETQERSLHLLHVMGATDDWLARLFRDLASSLTARAGIIASLAYLALILIVAWVLDLELTAEQNQRLAWTVSLSAPAIVLVLTIIAGQAARLEALRQLKRWS